MEDETPVLLDVVDTDPIQPDHPLTLTDADYDAGLAAWQAVDDLDDESNGVHARTAASPGRDRAIARARILRESLLLFGVPEVSIEPVPGRPGPNDQWNGIDPYSVISHHIASRPTSANPTPGLALVKRGRSDLPGPLANGTAGVDLVYRIICLGWANHPGVGGPWTVKGPVGSYTIPRDNARPYAWGTEYEGGYDDATWDRTYTNARTGMKMTFREFMGRANAGLVHGIWRINAAEKAPRAGVDLSGYHGEHKTWAPGRKPDRLNYSTLGGRAEIRKYQQQVTPEGEDDVSAADIWNYKIPRLAGKKPVTAKTALARAEHYAVEAVMQSRRNASAIKALAETIADEEQRSAVIASLGELPDLPDEPGDDTVNA